MLPELKSTGSPGLDEVLRGGLPDSNLHLVQGPPGSGKTTLALQFLRAGLAIGEKALYITLSQTRDELARIAASHGWDLDGIDVVELHASNEGVPAEQSIFQTADLRLDQTRREIERSIEAHAPSRVVYDSLLEVRLLTLDDPRFHRELIGLRTALSRRGITALLLDTEPSATEAALGARDMQARGIVHGIITLDKVLPNFGRAQRRIEVSKMRGIPVHDGWHDMDIRGGEGLAVFPRLVPSAGRLSMHAATTPAPLIRSGVERLDDLFGGGMELGTTTMVVGQAGTGKSTIASLYATAALERGEKVSLFLFEERPETLFRRSEGLGMKLREQAASGALRMFDFNPNEITAGEFSQIAQREADIDGVRTIVIDSFTGYMASVANEAQALFDIQALLKYLARKEILTILVVAQRGLLGANDEVRLDLSFLGDTVLLLRMKEDGGVVKRSLVPVKKRHGPHSMDIYELIIEPGRVEVGMARPS
ncbi:ATPase domain-containing protein [Acuticoccus mangrovi]|uniref:AAA family ATPase n=1 Tax=Acuticoccus mangrovi TaxID=2796142 RepID=A0A934MNR6_9HYPH|nr:ATPase domain-containing protein [Acuticoccus mangrovi]MBJ3778439.1 AAA family ATPase [Acuticoccus mangrovi]